VVDSLSLFCDYVRRVASIHLFRLGFFLFPMKMLFLGVVVFLVTCIHRHCTSFSYTSFFPPPNLC
jgi:hypothetical protein